MGLLRLPFSLNNEQRVAIGWLGGSHQPGFWRLGSSKFCSCIND